jgi:uncharacterized protein YggE
MARKHGRAEDLPPARPITHIPETPLVGDTTLEAEPRDTLQEEMNMTPSYGLRTQTPREGVTVIGEAVRRVAPECAEFLIEITTSGGTAAQALRDNYARTALVAEAVGPLGVQRTDIQTISLNVYNLYSPILPSLQSLPMYGGIPQVGQGAYSPYGAASPVQQPDVQFGSYHARNTLRVTVRDAGRVGDVVDTSAKAGAAIIGAFSFRVSDEAGARRAALEAAGRDAQAKAESLAAATGKKVGEPLGVTEDFVVSNGTYAALRTAMPFAFGAGSPSTAGELEFYARVSASFRFQ